MTAPRRRNEYNRGPQQPASSVTTTNGQGLAFRVRASFTIQPIASKLLSTRSHSTWTVPQLAKLEVKIPALSLGARLKHWRTHRKLSQLGPP